MSFTWVDTSEHSGVAVDDRYPYRSDWFSFRMCDGTYVDHLFNLNMKWTLRQSRLLGSTTYAVWPPSESNATWRETFGTITRLLGNVHRPTNTIMIDVETWGRAGYHRNFSPEIEALRAALVNWLFSLRPRRQRLPLVSRWYRRADNRRVWGYGNRGDLATMAPHVKFRNVIVADYETNWPTYPNMLGQQFTSHAHIQPWPTPVDLNRSPLTRRQFALRAGLGTIRWNPS